MKRLSIREMLLFEDDHYLVINKPAGISTLEDRNEPRNILSLATREFGDVQVGHRLDKETSGCLVLAKSAEAYRHLALQFERREVLKSYHAVTDGQHEMKDVMIDANIQSTARGQVRIHINGKPALTICNTLEVYRNHTLLECHPVTGRMHQVRIHLSYAGAPITGDPTYGGQYFFLSSVKAGYKLKKNTDELPVIRRVALHSHTINFQGLQDEDINVQAPYPKDFAVLLKQLRKYSLVRQ